MKIEQLDEKRILISLCDEEMQLYSVSFEELEPGETNSEVLLRELLLQAAEQTGIIIKNKHIMIEAMKFERGCLLLVTVSEKTGKRSFRVGHSTGYSRVLVFENAEALLGCICALSSMKDFRCSSALLGYKSRYYLVLRSSYPFEQGVINTAHEFDAAVREGRSYISSLYEHAEIIVPDHAVETICSALNSKNDTSP